MVSLISLILLSLEDNVAVQSGNWICLWEQGRSHWCWRENDKAERKRDLGNASHPEQGWIWPVTVPGVTHFEMS